MFEGEMRKRKDKVDDEVLRWWEKLTQLRFACSVTMP